MRIITDSSSDLTPELIERFKVDLVIPMKISIDGKEYLLREGESIVMPARHPHAVYGQEPFKMLLVVVF